MPLGFALLRLAVLLARAASPAPPSAPSATPAPGGAQPLRATPKARRYAQANGIDLADVAKTTGAAMITEAILMQYVEARR